jgi:hypothetical protein
MHSPTRLVAHRLLDSCSPSGPQAGAGQCDATPSKLLCQARCELAIGAENFARYLMGGGEGCLDLDGFSFGSCYHNLHPRSKTASLTSRMQNFHPFLCILGFKFLEPMIGTDDIRPSFFSRMRKGYSMPLQSF